MSQETREKVQLKMWRTSKMERKTKEPPVGGQNFLSETELAVLCWGSRWEFTKPRMSWSFGTVTMGCVPFISRVSSSLLTRVIFSCIQMISKCYLERHWMIFGLIWKMQEHCILFIDRSFPQLFCKCMSRISWSFQSAFSPFTP